MESAIAARESNGSPEPHVRHAKGAGRWEGVEIHPYKETGSHFKSISRQTLFSGTHDLPIELRYFEISPGGHSTLERHEHAHLVTILRGGGEALVGDEVFEVGPHDVIQVPTLTWHQFQARGDEPLGFLCVLRAERDRPERPSEDELARFGDRAARFVRL